MRSAHRDRPARSSLASPVAHCGPDLIARLRAWQAALAALLPELPAAALGPNPSPPAEYGFTPVRRGQPLTGRACLLHASEHSALHLGHLQLTRQLEVARRASDAAGRPIAESRTIAPLVGARRAAAPVDAGATVLPVAGAKGAPAARPCGARRIWWHPRLVGSGGQCPRRARSSRGGGHPLSPWGHR